MVRVINVRFEHHSHPAIGIGEPAPRVSWSFDGDEQDLIQETYQIEISLGKDPPETFTVQSSESRLVDWPCRPLVSREQAQVRVRVTFKDCPVTLGWSDYACVEVGLLHQEDWTAALVQPASESLPKEQSRPVVFRRTLFFERKLVSARLYITAHGIYDASINGRQVGDHVLAPGWTSYSHRLVYQTFDVLEHIQSGQTNTIDVTVAPGWFSGRLGFGGGKSNIYGDSLGLIAMLFVELETGETVVFKTDEHWKCAYGPYLFAELYDGVHYDCRQTISSDTAWHSVQIKSLPTVLVAPTGPPVRRTQLLEPVSIRQSPSGKTIVDFGQNFAGWIRLSVQVMAGTKITLQHVEVLEDYECATRPLRTAKAQDVVILSDESIVWEPKLTFHGFRYVQIDGFPGTLTTRDIAGIVVGTDMTRTGYFECSNSLITQLHKNVVWSMRANFISIPTDCPQRDERLGWTGDINVFADTANYLFDPTGMLISWLEDLKLEQKDGLVPLVIPNILTDFEIEAHAIWGDAAVMLPWSIYRATGDKEILTRQYSSMKAWLEAIPRKANGLWNYVAAWKLGDWLDPAAPPDDPGNATTDTELVSDAFLVHITALMASISKILKRDSDHSYYSTLRDELRLAFSREYITNSGRLACDTQTAFALAISFGLFDSKSQLLRAKDRLELLIRQTSHFKIATGFAGTPYIGHALSQVGHTNLFYRMLLHRENPSWLYSVVMGATTIWERWDSMLPDGRINPGEMTSFNHYALGAVANWMHCTILGLKPLEPGWRRYAVAPIPGGGLRWAEGKYISSYGECRVRWEIREASEPGKNTFWISLKVPVNTCAELTLPGWQKPEILHSGQYERSATFIQEEWPPKAIWPPTLNPSDELPED